MCRPQANQPRPVQQKFMPDDHSDLEPLLPIPNRTVKQVSADDSAGSRVKVGHRQALIAKRPAILCWALSLPLVKVKRKRNMR